MLHSRAYRLPKSRRSYFVTVDFEGEDPYVACIEYFVKVQALQHGDEGIAPMRFAVVNLYRRECLSSAALGICYVVKKAEVQSPKHTAYAVKVDKLQGKVVWADVGKTAEAALTFPPAYSWVFARSPHHWTYIDARSIDDVDDQPV